MPKYYKVKPEFDGRVIRYLVPDGRKRGGFRQEEIELIGCELLPPKKYVQIVHFKPYILDAFDEVKVNIYTVYRSFGALFKFGDSDIICGEYWTKRNILASKFKAIYKSVGHKCGSLTFETIVNWLSIETLEFAINYYENQMPKPTVEELLSISTEDVDLIPYDKEESTND